MPIGYVSDERYVALPDVVLEFVNLLEMLEAASDFLCLFTPSLKIFRCEAGFFFDILDRVFKTFLLQFIHC